MENITDGQLGSAFDALIRAMPEKNKLHHDNDANSEWLAEAVALVTIAAPNRAGIFKLNVENLYSRLFDPREQIGKLVLTLQQLRAEFRLKSNGPTTLAFEPGRSFDYFDEIRKILESATSEVFVVDPYLGADFIGRYLPHVKAGVSVRLLVQNQITQVRSAVDAYTTQYAANIEVRKSQDMHDRYIFIDGRECYHSGATFKDGAVKSPTTLTQIVDAFSAVLTTYESAWVAGKIATI